MLIRHSVYLQCAVGVLGFSHSGCPNDVSPPCLPFLWSGGIKVIPGGNKEMKKIITNHNTTNN